MQSIEAFLFIEGSVRIFLFSTDHSTGLGNRIQGSLESKGSYAAQVGLLSN
jgi:hypothetical protein